MNLLMVSGDRQVVVGEQGPFHAMQREFSRYFGRVDVLCPRPDGPERVRTIHGNVHFHPAPCGRLGMARWIADTGARLVREHGHRLVVSHDYGWFYNGLGSAQISRTTGVPYLSEIHHVPGHPVAADLRERFDRVVARAYLRWARHRALAFRVVNQVQMPQLLERWGVPREKVLVLPSLYIDLDVFHPGDAYAGSSPERPAPAEPGRPVDVCFVGRMVTNKGADRILEALRVLRGEGLELSAVFVGKGPLREELQQRAARDGLDVEWIEWVATPADLADVYRRARLCVCASTCEGGPRFTVEAMACGTPVVSTPVGVMGDLLSDGSAGRLAGFDAWSLARSIHEVLRDEGVRVLLGQEAARRARDFEFARAIGVYANGLRRLAGEPELGPDELGPTEDAPSAGPGDGASSGPGSDGPAG